MSNATKIRTGKILSHPLIGKWHFEFMFRPAYNRHGAMHFSLGFFKMVNYPPEGEMVRRQDYKGFWISRDIGLPVFATTHNFKTWEERWVGFLVWYGALSKCCHAKTIYDEGYDKSYCSACQKKV